jgi:hypothetical protein
MVCYSHKSLNYVDDGFLLVKFVRISPFLILYRELWGFAFFADVVEDIFGKHWEMMTWEVLYEINMYEAGIK